LRERLPSLGYDASEGQTILKPKFLVVICDCAGDCASRRANHCPGFSVAITSVVADRGASRPANGGARQRSTGCKGCGSNHRCKNCFQAGHVILQMRPETNARLIGTFR